MTCKGMKEGGGRVYEGDIKMEVVLVIGNLKCGKASDRLGNR